MQYYEKPKFKLYHANCLDWLAELSENAVDMVSADPLVLRTARRARYNDLIHGNYRKLSRIYCDWGGGVGAHGLILGNQF